MKVVFVSAFLNHHQRPLCEALRNLCEDFCFVATETVSNVGYQVQGNADYVLHYFDESQKENIRQKIAVADFVIFGSCPTELVEYRMAQNKLSFVYAERYFKRGTWRRFIPSTRNAIKKRIVNYGDKNLYVLSASAYLSYDLSLLGFPSEKCLKWGYFPEMEQQEDIGSVLDAKEKNSILWCGRMIPLKHPEHAIKMAKKLKDCGNKFELNMIGDGPLKNKMQSLVIKNGLADCVHILGSKSHNEVREHMNKSQIFVFNSNRREGWGAVINEAMNSGCCVVASHAVGSVPFLTKSGETGEIYKSGNIRELTEKVATLLKDPQKTRSMGESAYNSVINEWNAEMAARRLVLMGEKLLSDSTYLFESGPCSNAKVIKDNWYKKGVR